jgi:SAM-dependent methyltransferase
MRTRLLGRIAHSVRSHGLVGSLSRVAASCGGRVAQWPVRRIRRSIDERFDREYGVDTSGSIMRQGLGVESDSTEHATGYQAVFPQPFLEVLRQLPIDHSRFVFVDFGSGKGRALLLAAQFPFKRIVGVEFSPDLHRIAVANCRNHRGPALRCATIDPLCVDAVEYPIPVEPVVLFLYNPFDEQIMTRVAANIDRSLRQNPRPGYVVYYNARLAGPLEATPSLVPFPIAQPRPPRWLRADPVRAWVTRDCGNRPE